MAGARLEGTRPFTPPGAGHSLYLFSVVDGATAAWYDAFREELGRLDSRIFLPLWADVASGQTTAVRVPLDVAPADFIAAFIAAAERPEPG